MSQEDITRIEKKVNLLYQILLKLEAYDTSLNIREVFHGFMNELNPLFNISAEREGIEKVPSQEEMDKWKNLLENRLMKLEEIYNNGNYLAKEEDEIKNKIGDISSYLREWDEIINNIRSDYKEIEDKNKDIYGRNSLMNLEKKLGSLDKLNTSYLESLIKERDILKKKLKDYVEEIHILGEIKK